jgi:hypothetical protein
VVVGQPDLPRPIIVQVGEGHLISTHMSFEHTEWQGLNTGTHNSTAEKTI